MVTPPTRPVRYRTVCGLPRPGRPQAAVLATDAALRDQRVSVLRRPEHVPLDPLERAIREDDVRGRDIRPLEEHDPLGAVTR